MKYGALSTANGTVEIACEGDEETVGLRWTERGGPPVAHPPEREGFGTTLAKRSVAGDLAGTVTMEWAPEGLTIRVTASRERLAR